MQELTSFISNHPMLSIATAIIIVFLLIVEMLRAKKGSVNLSPSQATHLINRENAVVIDLRSQEAYRKGHIIDAQSFSAQEIKDNSKKFEKFKNKPLIVVCNTGLESQKITALLIKQGYNARALAGGIRSWIEAQMPLVKE